jgi:hypothetical protein
MVYHNLHQVHLQEIMLVVWPLDENQGPSQSHGQGFWLVCEVTPTWRTTKGAAGLGRLKQILELFAKLYINLEFVRITTKPPKFLDT